MIPMSTTLRRGSAATAGRRAFRLTLMAVSRALGRLGRSWRRRRRREALTGLSEHMLRDIGMLRCGIVRRGREDWSDPRY
jgi:uncharacterized protein YjiS (DUF1127 family)